MNTIEPPAYQQVILSDYGSAFSSGPPCHCPGSSEQRNHDGTRIMNAVAGWRQRQSPRTIHLGNKLKCSVLVDGVLLIYRAFTGARLLDVFLPGSGFKIMPVNAPSASSRGEAARRLFTEAGHVVLPSRPARLFLIQQP